MLKCKSFSSKVSLFSQIGESLNEHRVSDTIVYSCFRNLTHVNMFHKVLSDEKTNFLL